MNAGLEGRQQGEHPISISTEYTSINHDEDANVQEEDWSEFFQTKSNTNAIVEEDGDDETAQSTCHLLLKGFASHDELRTIRLDRSTALSICCASSLSPLDMIHLSYGTDDSTGHLIWMGALLFVRALRSEDEDKVLVQQQQHARNTNMDIECRSNNTPCNPINASFDSNFIQKDVIELGCGTGIAGIAVFKQCHPKRLIMTDANEAAISLTRKNCHLNGLSKYQEIPKQPSIENHQIDPTTTRTTTTVMPSSLSCTWNVQILRWGTDSIPASLFASSFDVVFATDVIYDLGVLSPLLQTTTYLLREGGKFILSHVPRAAIIPSSSSLEEVGLDNDSTSPNNNNQSNTSTTTTTTTTTATLQNGRNKGDLDDNDSITRTTTSTNSTIVKRTSSLEDYIIQQATSTQYNMCLESILRPLDLKQDLSCNDEHPNISLMEMEEAGAAIFIFVKR